MKACTKCAETKPLEDFYRAGGRAFARRPVCKTCTRIYVKQNAERDREYHRTHRRRQHLREKYGIELEDYLALLEQQNEVCAICHEECTAGRALAVDHDHANGQIRGLLCSRCNVGLGAFGDDIGKLLAAADYLRAALGLAA